MALYLVQHGKANPRERDVEPRLSEEGKRETRLVAEEAKRQGLKVRRIEHSGKARSKETAEIFASLLKPEGGLHERPGIQPLDDVAPQPALLKSDDELMLVGHLPFLEKLAALLITGSAEPMVIKFQNAGLVCLDQVPDTGRWFIKWTLMSSLK